MSIVADRPRKTGGENVEVVPLPICPKELPPQHMAAFSMKPTTAQAWLAPAYSFEAMNELTKGPPVGVRVGGEGGMPNWPRLLSPQQNTWPTDWTMAQAKVREPPTAPSK